MKGETWTDSYRDLQNQILQPTPCAYNGSGERLHVTGTSALKDKLVKSDVSGRYLCIEKASQSSIDNLICGPDEVAVCHWSERRIAKAQSFRCQWTGLRFSKQFSNGQDNFRVAEQLLEDEDFGEGGGHLAPWLEQNSNGLLKGLKSVRYVVSPRKGIVVLACDLRKGLQIWTRSAVFVMSVRKQKKLLGRVAFFKKGSPELEEQIAFVE